MTKKSNIKANYEKQISDLEEHYSGICRNYAHYLDVYDKALDEAIKDISPCKSADKCDIELSCEECKKFYYLSKGIVNIEEDETDG